MSDIGEKSESDVGDRLDYRIIRLLAADGRMSDVALGEIVGLSANAVARRRKLLEDRGVIRGYSAQVDLARLGFGIDIIVQVSLTAQTDDALSAFEEAVKDCHSISMCSFISGDSDFVLIVHARSFKDYDRTYRNEIASLPNVSRIRSSFVLRHVSQHTLAPGILPTD